MIYTAPPCGMNLDAFCSCVAMGW